MPNPVLLVKSAGRGETPACPDARFQAGDIVKVRRLKWLRHLPAQAAVAAVVPPGFPAEYALADAVGRDRPLMISRPSRMIRYVLAFENDETPYVVPEKGLLPTDAPRVQVGWTEPPAPVSTGA